MNSLKFDLSQKGSFKILNAVNGGPCHRRHGGSQNRSTLEDYKELRIPYHRNHDANHHGFYGGPFAHDVTAIFKDFDADPYNPDFYEFDCTDEAIAISMEAGTKVFYRLGESIELHIKKHHTLPPKDFEKWAVICEHIIRHYTEGWANGFEYDIEYWEVWNEPDLNEEKPNNRNTWGGTRNQYFDMYEITAKHLKKCFPNIKIGGPALASRLYWLEDFLYEMEKRQAPLDFISWHSYCKGPQRMLEKAAAVNELLCKYHFEHAERVLNEWNYIKGWANEDFIYSIKSIHGIKGATFVLSCMSEVQRTELVDMLMYYDVTPSIWNSLFDFYSFEKLKGYYSFLWAGMLCGCKYAINVENNLEDIYSLCGVDENDKILSVITYYSDDDTLENKQVSVDFGRKSKFEIYLLDDKHDAEFIGVTDTLEFDMKLHSAILIKEIEE